MTFRLTTLERAYRIAESGSCRTPGEVKARLKAEGFSNISDQLHGGTITKALKQRCDASYLRETGPVEA